MLASVMTTMMEPGNASRVASALLSIMAHTSPSRNEEEQSRPTTCDLLAQMLEGTEDPLHAPDPSLSALDKWCGIAMSALNDPDCLTGHPAEPLQADVLSVLSELRASPSSEKRVLLLLIVLHCNHNFQDYVGSRTPPELFQPFMRHLGDCWLHMLCRTRIDGQAVLRSADAEFQTFSAFVHHMRMTHLLQRLLTT